MKHYNKNLMMKLILQIYLKGIKNKIHNKIQHYFKKMLIYNLLMD